MTCKNNTNKKAWKQNRTIIYTVLQSALTLPHPSSLSTLPSEKTSIAPYFQRIANHHYLIWMQYRGAPHLLEIMSVSKSFLKWFCYQTIRPNTDIYGLYLQPRWPERQHRDGLLAYHELSLNCFKFPKPKQVPLSNEVTVLWKQSELYFRGTEVYKKQILKTVSYAAIYLKFIWSAISKSHMA